FSIFNTNHLSQYSCPGDDAFEEIRSRNISLGTVFITISNIKLGSIGPDGFHPLFKYFRDINYYIRFMIPILQELQKIFRPPFLLCHSFFIFRGYFGKTGKKTGIAYQVACTPMIRMAVTQYIPYNYFRLVFTNGLDKFQL